MIDVCMVDWAEGEWEQIEAPHMAKSRKEHRCGECGRTIQRGEEYERGTFAHEDGLTTVKTCRHCVAVRSWLRVWCNGWLFNGVLEDLEEHWDENWELRGRYLALAIAGIRRRWNGGADRVMGVYRKPKVMEVVA